MYIVEDERNRDNPKTRQLQLAVIIALQATGHSSRRLPLRTAWHVTPARPVSLIQTHDSKLTSIVCTRAVTPDGREFCRYWLRQQP